MLKPSLLGGVLGGLALFVWGAVSWMVLPWHMAALDRFTDEAAVMQAVAANAPAKGVYLLPNPHKHAAGMPEADGKAAEAEGVKRMRTGPFMFAAVTPQGIPFMGYPLLIQLLSDVVAAFLVTRFLLRTRGATYGCRVGLVGMVGLIVFAGGHLHYWNWWHFPTGYTLVNLADLVIGWSLAGVVIAKVTETATATAA